MKLHEYQAKQFFDKAGIPVPFGVNAKTPEEASRAFGTVKQMCKGGEGFVANVKAQLHAGGRGKVGGVVAVRSATEAATEAARLLGKRLVTKQTGPEGLPVSSVLVDERSTLAKEWYLALTIDRFRAQPMLLASALGGMDIEEVAATKPSAIIREPVELESGVSEPACAKIAATFGSAPDQAPVIAKIARAMWQVFEGRDASLIEINPLGVLQDGRIVAVDAKVTLDVNALFRHPELAAMRDESQEHPLELKAGRIGISYVGLEGNIGCLVNGAGLAMATNDIIKLSGGSPANFLDVGGGANVEQVTNAFSIILSDARVKAVLVNIFGGIMRCDWIAEGLLKATRQLDVKVPIVVRLQGTNVEEGRRLLAQAKRLNLVSIDELADAARRVVEFAQASA
ncbi:MAG: ADP-forming succinate--CoA ligase subunit beta [Candidatus Omnitrophica bacterium]|nr:ADP-forming succinate--CoA ligase subunit beta [Candidatus Omnitrophota bacterium]